MSLLPGHLDAIHVSSIGNGNMNAWNTFTDAEKSILMNSPKKTGFRFVLEKAAVPDTWVLGTSFAIEHSWSNVGLAPIYDDWNITFQLRNANTSVFWSLTSSFILKSLLPTTVVISNKPCNERLPSTSAMHSLSME